MLAITPTEMQTIELEDILYKALKASEPVAAAIDGGIFVLGERPEGSGKVDIVINTITGGTGTRPQNAVVNVNIHVPDLLLTIDGGQQRKANRERLRPVVKAVRQTINAANIEGLSLQIVGENIIRETQVPEHYANIRVNCYIVQTNE